MSEQSEPITELETLVAHTLCRNAYRGRSLDEYLSPSVQLWMRLIPEARAAIEAVDDARAKLAQASAPSTPSSVEVEITHEMMDAGQAYLNSKALNGRFDLPATFRWTEFWDALLTQHHEREGR